MYVGLITELNTEYSAMLLHPHRTPIAACHLVIIGTTMSLKNPLTGKRKQGSANISKEPSTPIC